MASRAQNNSSSKMRSCEPCKYLITAILQTSTLLSVPAGLFRNMGADRTALQRAPAGCGEGVIKQPAYSAEVSRWLRPTKGLPKFTWEGNSYSHPVDALNREPSIFQITDPVGPLLQYVLTIYGVNSWKLYFPISSLWLW